MAGIIATVVLSNIIVYLNEGQYNIYKGILEIIILFGLGIFYFKLYFEKGYLEEKNQYLQSEQRKYSLALDGLNGAIWEYNINSGKSFIVGKSNEILGLKSNNIKTLDDWILYVHPSDREKVREIFTISTKMDINRYLKGFFLEYRIIGSEDEVKWVFTKGKVEEIDGEYICSGVNIDISQIKIKEFALYESERRHRLAIEGSRDAIFEWKVKEDKFFVGDKIYEIMNIKEVPMKNFEDWSRILYKKDRKCFTDIINDSIKDDGKEYLEFEYRVLDKNNEKVWMSIKGKIERNLDGEATRLYGSLCNVTDKKEKELRIKYMSYYDSVTGLYNRYYLKKSINKYLKLHKIGMDRAALIFIDLDNFKYINDSFGHEYGDILLKSLSDSFKKIIGERDLLGRFGGDEFIIFLPNIESITQVEEILKGITSIFKYPQNILGNSIYTSGSVGISMFPDDAMNFETLLKNADAAMYRAKSNGKDTYQFFNDQIANELMRLYEIEEGLREALDNKELYVEFQPKVVLTDHKIMGFEALARWKNKKLGSVSPAEFIPVAENTRMILNIGRFVLEEIFIKCKHFIEIGHDNFKIAVNLSEVQLREGNIVKEFKDLILEYGISPKYIEVEITESILMKSFDNNIKTLMALKALDVSIALDDFGTGYSSLNYLTKLPIDILKIDRSFLLDIMENAKSKFVVENIIQLSHKLGIEVVAEGVEVKEQVDYLKSIFCDFVQGYYFSRPQSFEKAVIMMKDRYIAI